MRLPALVLAALLLLGCSESKQEASTAVDSAVEAAQEAVAGTVEQAEDVREAAAPQATAVVLAVREAVTNIQRHARAGDASVSLRSAGQQVSLRIEDDGRGGAIVPGNGLCGMRERIEALGGKLRVDAAAGQGTHIEIVLPLSVPGAVEFTAPTA